jgi:hypothetical protein
MSEYQHKPASRNPDVEELLDYGFRPVAWLPPFDKPGMPPPDPMGMYEALQRLDDRKKTLQLQHEENERAQAEGRPARSVLDTPDTPPEEWPDLP